jgi:VIT1/CCC1 family predicted Fe2+/Mn2+ transporter
MLMWQYWVTALLGLLVLAVPFLNLSGSTLMWTLALAGIVTAALGFWGAAETSERPMVLGR